MKTKKNSKFFKKVEKAFLYVYNQENDVIIFDNILLSDELRPNKNSIYFHRKDENLKYEAILTDSQFYNMMHLYNIKKITENTRKVLIEKN